MDLQLSSKTAIVTGGSRGTGKATAMVLAAEGVQVGILSRSAAALEETATAIGRSSGGTVIPLVADICYTDAVNAAVERMAGVPYRSEQAEACRPAGCDTAGATAARPPCFA